MWPDSFHFYSGLVAGTVQIVHLFIQQIFIKYQLSICWRNSVFHGLTLLWPQGSCLICLCFPWRHLAQCMTHTGHSMNVNGGGGRSTLLFAATRAVRCQESGILSPNNLKTKPLITIALQLVRPGGYVQFCSLRSLWWLSFKVTWLRDSYV